jgi:retinol-binding protein 3
LMRLALALVATLVLPSAAAAQGPKRGPDAVINASLRSQVIAGVSRRLEGGYVFPDKAAEMVRALHERAQRGAYDRIISAHALADTLTRHLQAVSRDKHLTVEYDSRGIVDEPPDAEPPAGEQRRRMTFARWMNFGLERVERLMGNIGYLEIRSFNFGPAEVDSALAAAMNLLAHTNALIIDVRRNGGGEPEMVAAVCSYLMPPNTLVNKFYWRPQDRWDEFRTKPVSGRHYGTTRPVYVLTSENTFSGAEEFAYDIQTQKRGEVVGDTTGGGAHPGGMRQVTANFGVWVPSGRAVNPVTNTNWEGTGVLPDVPADASGALGVAHRRALKRLIAEERDTRRRELLEEALRELERTLHS